ncbi:hypothetical protein FXF51_32875 [Nonomuraea sp. PA05]|uniref:hypothetical protein n=1 Tax=Nonomuraea sp. PA05 TaxID=2604466 RepID=UPI0011D483C1|nr:hypothetical protein [Nonomuraea sp. PA05]TYB59811.1 hypothetical protein FXF51_32875 [Nonomuraea sp. PA05]
MSPSSAHEPAPGVARLVVRVELSRSDALALAMLLRAAHPLSRSAAGSRTGPLAVLPDLTPGQGFLDTYGAARHIGIAASTIRSWTARGGPKHHPFPMPSLRHQRRNYWQVPVIERWRLEEENLERANRQARRQKHPRPA